jgi:hypothetical protein
MEFLSYTYQPRDNCLHKFHKCKKPTFINYHKEKYTLLRKIVLEIIQWTTTYNTQKFRQMPEKTLMCGNPTRERQRERERSIIQLQEITYQQQNNISSQGKYLTTSNLPHKNMPRFSCQNCFVVRHLSYLVFHAHSELYGLFHTAQQQPQKIMKSTSKTMPEMPRFPCQIRTIV